MLENIALDSNNTIKKDISYFFSSLFNFPYYFIMWEFARQQKYINSFYERNKHWDNMTFSIYIKVRSHCIYESSRLLDTTCELTCSLDIMTWNTKSMLIDLSIVGKHLKEAMPKLWVEKHVRQHNQILIVIFEFIVAYSRLISFKIKSFVKSFAFVNIFIVLQDTLKIFVF